MGTMKTNIREDFRQYLEKKGLRNTHQRSIILDAFVSAGGHITAQDLHARISADHPEIGFATVHRNLKLLCEAGLADEIKIGTMKARYEPVSGREHHDHLICVICGQFIEVHDDRLERIQDRLARDKGFTPLYHKLEIFGKCSKCQ